MDNLIEVSDLFKSYELDFQTASQQIKSFLRKVKDRKIASHSISLIFTHIINYFVYYQ